MIKLVILDNDGTMRDSRAMITRAYKETFEHFNLAMPSQEMIAAYMHAGPEKFFGALTPHENTQELTTYYRSILGNLLGNIHAYDGVSDTLQKLRDMGLQLAVVSASKFLQHDLASNGIENYFDYVVDGHAVTRPKPDPEGINIVLRHLRVAPQEAIYIGDLPADVVMGKAAGLKAVIAVTHGFATKAQLQQSAPDYFVESFSELIFVVKKLANA
jgi:HAD superfamily hydrolase (TIGR01509 family)